MIVEKQVLTVEDVATALGICRALVYRQVRDGIIPSIKVGDRYLIPRVAFERWLSGDQVPVVTAPKYSSGARTNGQ